MTWHSSNNASICVYIFAVTTCLGLFGFSSSTSEPTEREQWFGSIDCPKVLSARWNELLSRPPYVERKDNSTSLFGGLFPDFLEMMLTECCHLSTTLVYNSTEADEPDLDLPVVVNLEADCKMNKHSNLVPMLPYTGIAFVVVKANKSNHSLKMLKSLLATWPVLVLTLILSLIAGIIAWSMERKKNPDDFPPTFTKGSWEGFWWAFVSMTTVGYGDRCPKSVGGRLFAVVWILMGICVCSIFTAALTSSLTTLSMETKVNLPGTKVVALLDSIESTTGFRNQANLKRVQTAYDVHKELESGRVQGALMDAYFLVYFKQHYPTSNLKVQEVLQQDKLEYGVRVKDIELASCFREKRYTMESALYEMAELSLSQSLSSGLDNEDKAESNIFDPKGILFFPMLFTCLVVTAVLGIAGVAWDLCRRFKCCVTEKDKNNGMSVLLRKTSFGEFSDSVKCYISQEKLQDLENKIKDINKALDLIKDGITFDKSGKKFSRLTLTKDDQDPLQI